MKIIFHINYLLLERNIHNIAEERPWFSLVRFIAQRKPEDTIL